MLDPVEKSNLPSNVFSRDRWIGKPARTCRCGSPMFHVNGMGGLVCTACSPPRSDLDVQMRLMVIVIGATFDGEDPPSESGIHWTCWGERAFAAVEENRRPHLQPTAAATSPTSGQRKLTGGKVVWADADEEEVNQRLAAAKGESLDEFRRLKMESF